MIFGLNFVVEAAGGQWLLEANPNMMHHFENAKPNAVQLWNQNLKNLKNWPLKITLASFWGWRRSNSNQVFWGFHYPSHETCFHGKIIFEFARRREYWTHEVEHLWRLISPRWRLLDQKFHFCIKAKTHSFQEWCGNPTFSAKKWSFGAFENDVPKFGENWPNFETSISRG